MRRTDQSPGSGRKLTRVALRLASRLAAVIEECRYAQRRANALRLAPDSYIYDPGSAPDTYSDFLYRTSGPSPREPSARGRAAGRQVKS